MLHNNPQSFHQAELSFRAKTHQQSIALALRGCSLAPPPSPRTHTHPQPKTSFLPFLDLLRRLCFLSVYLLAGLHKNCDGWAAGTNFLNLGWGGLDEGQELGILYNRAFWSVLINWTLTAMQIMMKLSGRWIMYMANSFFAKCFLSLRGKVIKFSRKLKI